MVRNTKGSDSAVRDLRDKVGEVNIRVEIGQASIILAWARRSVAMLMREDLNAKEIS